MRHFRTGWIIAAVAAIAFGGQAYAFHDGGVADCAGCHSMHSAESAIDDGVADYGYLLTKTDQSSTCLNCHEVAGLTSPSSYHISTAAADLVNDTDVVAQRTPGGDFGWLRQDLSAPASYSAYVTIWNYGYTRGHNIVAADNDYTADPINTTAPGGSMTSANLGCQSCHDPHGSARIDSTGTVVFPTVGSTHPPTTDSGSYGTVPAAGEAVGIYRLLGAAGYQAGGVPDAFTGAPAAVAPSTYNRNEVTNPTRVAYGYGTTGGFVSWADWCATCHAGMHTDSPGSPGGYVHPVQETLGGEAANYNAYVKTGDLTGAPGTTAFTSLVPFASPTSSIATLAGLANNDGSVLTGPAGTDRIACLTCHRAHASGWEYSMRWNTEAEFLTLGAPAAPIYPGVELAGSIGNQGQFNRGYTSAQMEAAYQGRPATQEFAGHQRSLCNKCHLKD